MKLAHIKIPKVAVGNMYLKRMFLIFFQNKFLNPPRFSKSVICGSKNLKLYELPLTSSTPSFNCSALIIAINFKNSDSGIYLNLSERLLNEVIWALSSLCLHIDRSKSMFLACLYVISVLLPTPFIVPKILFYPQLQDSIF